MTRPRMILAALTVVLALGVVTVDIAAASHPISTENPAKAHRHIQTTTTTTTIPSATADQVAALANAVSELAMADHAALAQIQSQVASMVDAHIDAQVQALENQIPTPRRRDPISVVWGRLFHRQNALKYRKLRRVT